MKKVSLIKKILLTIIFLLATSLVTVSAASYPSKITVGKLTMLDDYMGYEVDFNYKKTAKGSIIYCLEYPKDVPTEGMNLSYDKTADAGLTYIIQNGYPTKSITGDNKKDYYVTQVAIWLYLNQSTEGLDLIKRDMTTKSGTMYKALNNLVEGAKKAKNAGYASSSMKLNISKNALTLTSDGKYYVSEEFGITANNIDGNYKVSLTNAPKGTLVQTVKGTNTNEFTQNSKFIIKVPVSSISELKTNLEVKVASTGAVEKSHIYTTGNSKYQKMIVAKTYKDTKELSDSAKLSITTDKVIINKTDSKTGKNIAGATLVVKNEKGKVVDTFISTTKSKVLMNLPAGKYTITEKIAPIGYKKTDKVYEFTIKNTGKENKFNVVNTKKEEKVEIIHTVKVEISKQDITTKQELPGATLVIKNEKGKIIDTWVSSDKPHYLTLEDGKYTLIERSAPNGYVLSEEEIVFEINEDTKEMVKVVMYNTPRDLPTPPKPEEPKPEEPTPTPEEPKEEVVVEVPKTDVNSSLFYGLTASISALGYGLMKKFGRI